MPAQAPTPSQVPYLCAASLAISTLQVGYGGRAGQDFKELTAFAVV